MNTTYTPFLRKKRATDTIGYVTIRKTHLGKSTYRSLGLTLPIQYWDPNRHRVKTRIQDSTVLNDRIHREIERMKCDENTYQPTILDIESDPTVEYLFQDQVRHLTRLNKHSTALITDLTYGHLVDFWGAGRGPFRISNINTLLVRDFESYLRSKLNINSAKKYVAVFRRVYKEGRSLGMINNPNDPFLSFRATRVPTKRDYLTKEEVENLRSLDLDEHPKLRKVKQQFLFQLFAHGLRVSDLMTMRWGNYQSGELQFVQFKTKSYHTVSLNKHSFRIMGELLPDGIQDLLDTNFNGIYRGRPVAMTYDQWHNCCKIEEGNVPLLYAQGNPEILEENENLQNQLLSVTELFVTELHRRISLFSQSNPNQFIFDILPNTRFAKVKFDESTTLTRDLFELMKSRTARYNYQLKHLQRILGIPKTFSTHMMRCTFASLMVDETNRDYFSIASLIGHRSSVSLRSYVVNTLRKRQDIATNQFGGLFN